VSRQREVVFEHPVVYSKPFVVRDSTETESNHENVGFLASNVEKFEASNYDDPSLSLRVDRLRLHCLDPLSDLNISRGNLHHGTFCAARALIQPRAPIRKHRFNTALNKSVTEYVFDFKRSSTKTTLKKEIGIGDSRSRREENSDLDVCDRHFGYDHKKKYEDGNHGSSNLRSDTQDTDSPSSKDYIDHRSKTDDQVNWHEGSC